MGAGGGGYTGGFEGTTICCAYSVAGGAELPAADMRTHLATLIPRYMLPARWAVLDALPKNVNGKIDRPALRERFSAATATAATTPPRSPGGRPDGHCRPRRQQLRDQVGAGMSDRAGIDIPDAEADLLDAGLIDSLALVTLIVAFEDTFGVQLPLDDFDIDRFRSVASIADFLASLGAEPVRD